MNVCCTNKRLFVILIIDLLVTQLRCEVTVGYDQESGLDGQKKSEVFNATGLGDPTQNKPANGNITVTLPKCCPNGEILSTSGCESNGTAKFNPEFYVLDLNDTHINDDPLTYEDVNFQPFISFLRCRGKKYPLYPEDNYLFLRNGSMVFLDEKVLLSPEQFCVETIYEEDEWLTVPLICAPNIDPPEVLYYLYATGILVSSIFFLLTAAVFFFVGERFHVHGTCITGYSFSMAFSFICLSSAQFLKVEGRKCNLFGYILQFFLSSSFSWLVLLCFETYFMIRHHEKYNASRNLRLNCYFGISLGAPSLILLISVFSTQMPFLPKNMFKPQFGHSVCWFEGHKERLYFFYLPIIMGICFSIGNLLLAKFAILKLDKENSGTWKHRKEDLKQMFRASVLIVTIITVCWIAEVVSSMIETQQAMTPAADILESLQGLIVFMIFVLHDPVKGRVLKRCCKKRGLTRSSTEEHESFIDAIMRASATEFHLRKL